jgi:predicted dehydrogenase
MLLSRRSFFAGAAIGAGVLSANSLLSAQPQEVIQGFDDFQTNIDLNTPWQPISERKIKMGLVGYGQCRFSTQFSLQHHPNVEIVAVSDLIPERCADLAKAAKCSKTYPSHAEMLKDKDIEAIYVATDAPSHARLCIETLQHGKHVATAVPAVWGNMEEAQELLETVKKTGLVYTMFETSAYRDNCYAMREIYKAGGFGKIVYTEGAYCHYMRSPLESYKGWRTGSPRQYYPTHATAYYVAVTGGSFTEVSCMGYCYTESGAIPKNNPYKNKFGSEIALFRTNSGSSARMIVTCDVQGHSGETGRNFGTEGSFLDSFKGSKKATEIVSKLKLKKPQLPPGVEPGGHGGSHGYLGNDFVEAILLNRRPWLDIVAALNMTVPGIIAHQSALKNGELLKIPQYSY